MTFMDHEAEWHEWAVVKGMVEEPETPTYHRCNRCGALFPAIWEDDELPLMCQSCRDEWASVSLTTQGRKAVKWGRS